MKKISLSSVKEFLSRDEMRAISGGSGACGMQFSCESDNDCAGLDPCKTCTGPLGWCESY